MRSRLCWAAVVMMLGAPGAGAQVARDGSPAVGTAIIRGVVVSDDRPVSRAMVTLLADSGERRGALTDHHGNFEFERVAAARYTLSATRAGYVTSAFGAARPGKTGTTLIVEDGDRLTDLRLMLVRGGVVNGTVRDLNGRGVGDLQVVALPAHAEWSFTTVAATASGLTDSGGAYRIYGLPPDEYLLVAIPRTGQPPGAQIAESIADVDAVLERLRLGAGGRVTGSGSMAPGTIARPHMAVPIFYPGTPLATAAAVIPVAAGAEQHGVDIAFTPALVATIEGNLLNVHDRERVQMRLTPYGRRLPLSSSSPASARPRGPDNEFTFTGVTPGRYELLVHEDVEDGVTFDRTPPRLWGAADIEVNGRDIEGVVLALRPSMSVSGRVVLAGSEQPTPADLEQVQLTLSTSVDELRPMAQAPVAPNSPMGAGIAFSFNLGGGQTLSTTFVEATGTFTFAGLLPGRHQLRVLPPEPLRRWQPASLVVNGRDLLDTGVVIEPDVSISGAVLTLTDRLGMLQGRVLKGDGTPSTDHDIVIAAADPALRDSPRRTRSARPDSRGQYVFENLPPGDYLIAAVVDFAPSALTDAFFLDTLVTHALRVTIAAGENRQFDIGVR